VSPARALASALWAWGSPPRRSREQLGGLGAGLVDLEDRGRAEREAALLGADAIADDELAAAARAEADSEAGQGVVEMDDIGLAGRRGEGGNGALGELHLGGFLEIGTRPPRGAPLPPPRGMASGGALEENEAVGREAPSVLISIRFLKDLRTSSYNSN
jgi:hypothetical protein